MGHHYDISTWTQAVMISQFKMLSSDEQSECASVV